ncbi:glycosyltransferase, exosortase A system-associated [Niveibacterium sp. 24ML]|uniref:TIGR04063 family PEP-CTERM/XrtA system glycosyltransferase n=1 Tax=Niveibacterium sp. 24ML TaxID=2985512 RepID=UPI00226EB77E|nr:TIGR04063 family PEP-CTERM/XrtA system glycosyltransferase [Niveibacterium sp. 24ML]MCX9156874.1 glycosyltransferase, exosortase A system-associated [Niveibacterium sp. 24ML]
MRILHVLDHSIPLHSGYTFRTAAILREQARLGWETHHLTSPKQGTCKLAVETVDGLVFHRTPVPTAAWSGKPLLGELELMRQIERRLDELIVELKPQVLHAHSPVLNAIPAIRAARRHGLPVVYEVRAFWEDAAVDHGTTHEGSLRYRATRALETWAFKRVDHVTCICEGLRADIVARGIPSERVTVIPNAVDAEAFTAGAAPDLALKGQLGLEGAEVLGFIGSFYAYEGLDLLLEALPAILKRRPNARVLLVGGGPQDANLKQQVAAMGLQEKVVFTGRVPHEDVGRYYDLVDVLVYPRHPMRLTELVTPLKPLEAMAQQRVFVASDVGGHRELVRDGETGVLFRAGNAVALADAAARLLAEPERWPLIKAAGRRFVERERTWRNSVARYQSIYTRLIGEAVRA